MKNINQRHQSPFCFLEDSATHVAVGPTLGRSNGHILHSLHSSVLQMWWSNRVHLVPDVSASNTFGFSSALAVITTVVPVLMFDSFLVICKSGLRCLLLKSHLHTYMCQQLPPWSINWCFFFLSLTFCPPVTPSSKSPPSPLSTLPCPLTPCPSSFHRTPRASQSQSLPNLQTSHWCLTCGTAGR